MNDSGCFRCLWMLCRPLLGTCTKNWPIFSEGLRTLERWMLNWVGKWRSEAPITNVFFAGSIFLSLFLPFSSPLFRIPEFAPPQLIYSYDLYPMLLAPWTCPNSLYRILSRPLQSALLFRLPHDALLPLYFIWITIASSRTLAGFLLSRGIGWVYPRLFNHWALYESISGCGPPLLAYLIISGARPDFSPFLTHLRRYKLDVSESVVFLVICFLFAALDQAPWTYGIAIGLAIFTLACRTLAFACRLYDTAYFYPGPESPRGFPLKHTRTDIRMAFLFLALIPAPSIIFASLTSQPAIQMSSLSSDDAPFLDIVVLSHPRPNDTPSSPDHASILSQTVASYLPYISPSTSLSVFTHAKLFAHPSFLDAQSRFQDAPVIFYADPDAHSDAQEGQYLHLAEAFRWLMEKNTRTNTPAKWVMLVEDDFPICGDWGWQGLLRVMKELDHGYNDPSPETPKVWGGFVGTGGSGLILHRSLLPILEYTLRLHALSNSPFPASMAPRPADIIIQDCLLGWDPLCPTARSFKDIAAGTRRRPTMVISSRLVMDHIGGSASTIEGRVYSSNMWRCGWRHAFHGLPEVIVVPVQ